MAENISNYVEIGSTEFQELITYLKSKKGINNAPVLCGSCWSELSQYQKNNHSDDHQNYIYKPLQFSTEESIVTLARKHGKIKLFNNLDYIMKLQDINPAFMKKKRQNSVTQSNSSHLQTFDQPPNFINTANSKIQILEQPSSTHPTKIQSIPPNNTTSPEYNSISDLLATLPEKTSTENNKIFDQIPQFSQNKFNSNYPIQSQISLDKDILLELHSIDQKLSEFKISIGTINGALSNISKTVFLYGEELKKMSDLLKKKKDLFDSESKKKLSDDINVNKPHILDVNTDSDEKENENLEIYNQDSEKKKTPKRKKKAKK